MTKIGELQCPRLARNSQQIDRQTDNDRQIERDMRTNRLTDNWSERQRDKDRWTDKQWIERQTETERGGQETDMQTDRQL